jgi:hypothetical protein
LPGDAPIPDWAARLFVCAITRTEKELTIVCPQRSIPAGSACDSDWRCLRIDGSFDLNQTGVIASLAGPLAAAGIGIFVVSTYDTDYVLVRDANIERAVVVMSDAGHEVCSGDNERQRRA